MVLNSTNQKYLISLNGNVYELTAPARLKIGKNIAITIPPIITPRNTISNGSISEVNASTSTSISES